ncbi:hypothetical protein [Streptomyces populi]|uniref:TetR/AcrR family transcriptional regulator n=1 Tax=Streptomyces populi TaxID=2058924 RepID=UPI003B849AFD
MARGAVGSRHATRLPLEFIAGTDRGSGPAHPALVMAAGRLLGIAVARCVLAVEPLVTMPLEEPARSLAPSVQVQSERLDEPA